MRRHLCCCLLLISGCEASLNLRYEQETPGGTITTEAMLKRTIPREEPPR